MSVKLNKIEIQSLVNFIHDGFLVHDVYFFNTYLTFRSLTKTDRNVIHLKYKYLDSKFNLSLILEILSKVIYRIGGIEVNEETIKKTLKTLPSTIVAELYKQYGVAEEEFDALLSKIEIFAKTNESRNFWQVYKQILNVENLNEHQYFWALININKDRKEEYKFEWSKIEYMTNSICAFINPKEFKRLKSQMNITQQFDDDDEDFELEEQEQDTKGLIDLNKTAMNQMVRKEGENQQEYAERVSSTLVEMNKGKIIDEHDQVVRDYEINYLKGIFRGKRTQIEVGGALKKRTALIKTENLNIALSKDGMYHEEEAYIGDDSSNERIIKEMQKEGFYFNGNSYAEIANDRYFASIPKDEKERAFTEVMQEKIDINGEVEKLIKKTSDEPEALQESKTEKPSNTITAAPSVTKSTLVDSKRAPKDSFKEEVYFEETEEEFIKKESAAFKAAHMNIDLNSKVKVVKNTPKEINKKIIEKGKNLDTDDNVDQMIIK